MHYRMIYDYTKSVLERVSDDVQLFRKELKKHYVVYPLLKSKG